MELSGDEERVEAFRQGDREVLTALYRAHRGAVERMLRGGFTFTSAGKTYRFGGFHQPFALQEAVQDGFVHAFRLEARRRYDASQRFEPYLLAIIRNRVIDGFRRKRLEGRLFVPLGALAPRGDDGGGGDSELEALERLETGRGAGSGDVGDPEARIMQQQLQEVLQGFVASEELDEVDRLIVRRHLMGELSQREVAEELDIDRNEVRKRIKQMRVRLLRHLKATGFISTLDGAEALRHLAAGSLVLGALLWGTGGAR